MYVTFTMISVGSWIFGTGRSSRATLYGPWNTTAFMVSLVAIFCFCVQLSAPASKRYNEELLITTGFAYALFSSERKLSCFHTMDDNIRVKQWASSLSLFIFPTEKKGIAEMGRSGVGPRLEEYWGSGSNSCEASRVCKGKPTLPI